LSEASVKVSYGRFLMQEENCAEALPYFETASKDIDYPSRANAIYLIGMCSLQLENIERARGSFEHALNLSPRHAKSAIELAEIYFKEKNYPKAKENLDVFYANAKQSPRSLLLGIRIERIFGNKDKEASYALALKNLHPYSNEYLEYKKISSE